MKKQSLNTRLFLKINALQGISRPLDIAMLFAANVIVFVLGAAVVVFAVSTWWNKLLVLETFFLFLVTALVIGLGASWWVAWMWPHGRPIIEHPGIKQMFHPMSTWKSFPSDHTIVAFILAESLILFHPTFWLSCGLIIMALIVGVSRVYSGVHYPRDIVGGILFASSSVLLCAMIFGLISVY